VVDLKNLTKIAVDTFKGTAVIETGNRLGNIALALNDAGRAMPHGTCPDVGIGGHSGKLNYSFHHLLLTSLG
jgi:FAD/FMN-containing dehydrogenase